MSKQLQLKIITPEKLIFDEMVDTVTVPTTEGEIGILKDHIPLISGIASGDVVAIEKSEHIPFAVSGGFVEIKNEKDKTTVVVLADFAEHVSELTEEIIAKARNFNQTPAKPSVDFEHFVSELERSLTRVKIADKWKNRKYRR